MFGSITLKVISSYLAKLSFIALCNSQATIVLCFCRRPSYNLPKDTTFFIPTYNGYPFVLFPVPYKSSPHKQVSRGSFCLENSSPGFHQVLLWGHPKCSRDDLLERRDGSCSAPARVHQHLNNIKKINNHNDNPLICSLKNIEFL